MTLRRWCSLCVGLLCCAFALGAGAQEWKSYRYAEDGFAISFPEEPSVTKSPSNAKVPSRTYLANAPSTALLVSVSDNGERKNSEDPDTQLRGTVKTTLADSKSRLMGERQLAIGSYPGLEFESENNENHVVGRLFLVGNRLYQLLVVTEQGKTYPDGQRFFDSFELTLRAGAAPSTDRVASSAGGTSSAGQAASSAGATKAAASISDRELAETRALLKDLQPPATREEAIKFTDRQYKDSPKDISGFIETRKYFRLLGYPKSPKEFIGSEKAPPVTDAVQFKYALTFDEQLALFDIMLRQGITREDATPDTLSEKEYKIIESQGIARTSPMDTELSPEELSRLKQIIKDKPAVEAKSFRVTRSFLRRLRASKGFPHLNESELKDLKQFFDYQYCNNSNEQMDAMNAFVYFLIEPVRGGPK